MKKYSIGIILVTGMLALLPAYKAWSQDRFFTKNGKVTFTCGTALEEIKAVNTGAYCVLAAGTGQVQAAVLLKAFAFEKDLMEQHFNENYVESDKFPKSTFAGHITNIADVNFSQDGTYPVTLAGDFTLHGVTRPIKADGIIEIRNGKPYARTDFHVPLKDYDISIPGVVKDKIAQEASVSLEFGLAPFEGRP